MSGAEKRHFTLASSIYPSTGKAPLYLQLFWTLAKPESELSEFTGSFDPTILYSAKKQLFENILKSLRRFHQEKSIEIKIQNYLSDVEVLLGLSLPEQSLYILKKASALAVKYEKFRLLLQIFEWERRLNMVLAKQEHSIQEISIKEEDTLRKLIQIVHLENIYSKAKDMKKLQGSIKENMQAMLEKETINAPGMITLEECTSQNAKFYFNFIHTLFHWMTYNHKMAYTFSKELLNPEVRSIMPNDYLDGILEHVTSCIQIGEFEEALEGLDFAANYINDMKLSQTPAFSTKVFFYTTGYRLVLYNYMGEKEKLTAAIKTIEEELKFHEKHMPLEAKQVLLANLMNAYVGIGNWENVNALWNRLFNKASKTIRREIYDDLFLFRLFNLLQSEIYAILPSMALSAIRNYKQSESPEKQFNVELKIATLCLKECDLEHPKIREELLSNIKMILTRHINNMNGAPDFQEHYSFYIIWTESILQKEPFYKIAAKWFSGFMQEKE